MLNIFKIQPSLKNLFFLFFITFLIRSAVFYFYVQNEERFWQADSLDYHQGALCINLGYGMTVPTAQGEKPIFWRTPGYPWYLSFFYQLFPGQGTEISNNSAAIKASIWIQILICSLLPILIFFLAFLLTNLLSLSWIAAWITALHPGFILASTYLLTDGLAAVIFTIFLILLYKGLLFEKDIDLKNRTDRSFFLLLSALILGLFSWIRPMGQVIAIASVFLICFTFENWKRKFLNIFLFVLAFFGSISPWIIRNYNLTGHCFFCPIMGPYLTCFSAPKIHSKVNKIPLEESHGILTRLGGSYTVKEMQKLIDEKSAYVVCPQIACLPAALGVIKEHPFFFMRDWIVEVIKTTFDLYSWQLVAFAKKCYKWDPMIEYLDEKVKECLYKVELPWFSRLIAWLELIFYIFIWIAIFTGVIKFMLLPILGFTPFNKFYLWFKTLTIFVACVAPTGGFGYARLRLPVEALIIILALEFYFWLLKENEWLIQKR